MTRTQGLWEVYRWPLFFVALSLFGLASALLGDDGWDWLSVISLGSVPTLIIARMISGHR